jgi:hypothetical protein
MRTGTRIACVGAKTDPAAMSIFEWFGRRNGGATRAWHERWRRAVAAPAPSELSSLEAALRRQPPMADDLELEEEMLEALRNLVDLSAAIAESRLPVVETSHRVVGHDVCHYSAAVSMPDDPAQPTGRLLLTSTRAAFAGGARLPALAWHSVRGVAHDGRDVLFMRGDEQVVRFRCNSFTDAVCGAAIARYLSTVNR